MSKSPTPDAIRAVEDRVLQLSTPATNGWALMVSVEGGVLNPNASPNGKARVSAAQWQLIIKALKAGERVGALQIDDSGKWLRLRTGEALTAVAAPVQSPNSSSAAPTISASASLFEAAVAFAVDFVTKNPLCTFGALGGAVAKQHGSAAWARIKAEVTNNPKHATPIWHRGNKVAMDQGRFAKATPSKKAPALLAAPVASAAPASPASPAAPAVRARTVHTLRAGQLNRNVGVTLDDDQVCAYLFDLSVDVAHTNIVAVLQWLLQSADVAKVFHDVRRDVPALCRKLQLQRGTVQALFDTQVLFEVLVESGLAQRRYKGARASLNDVLRACDLPVNEQKQSNSSRKGDF